MSADTYIPKLGDWVCGIIRNNYTTVDTEIVGIITHICATGKSTDFVHVKCPIYSKTFVVRQSNIIRHKKSSSDD